MAVIKQLNLQAKVKQVTDSELFTGPIISNKVLAFYDAIVGSSAQVASGAATHTSIQAAHNYVSSGGNILVLEGTYTENVIISKTIRITGQGHNSMLNGTIQFASGASFCAVELIRFLNNITFTSSSNGNFLTQSWLATGFTLSDAGSGNYKVVIGE